MILVYSAAFVFAYLGAVHLFFTIRDFGRNPKYFRPNDLALFEALKQTKPNIAPNGRDYWTALLGFNVTHSFAAMFLALLILLVDPYQILWLKPVLCVLALGLTYLAWRCWFLVPQIMISAATVALIVGWVLF